MRWLVFVFLLACAEDVKPSLEGPYTCGPQTCGSGQICVTVESGSQCGVNPETGVGPYEVYSWSCVDLPDSCDGVPSCDCVNGGAICFGPSEDGREVAFGCI
ncbi:MAG TPA: hypothetical protein VIU61_23485 [Kofleriaceae bacterium]